MSSPASSSRRSTVLGAYFTIGALGGVAGPLLYVVIAPLGGWRAFWWVFVAAAAALTAFAVAVTPTGSMTTRRCRAPLRWSTRATGRGPAEWTGAPALATPQFYVIVGAYTMYLLINTTAHGFAVEHLIERGISARSRGGACSASRRLIGAGVSVVGGVVGEKVQAQELCSIDLPHRPHRRHVRPGRGARPGR